MNPSTASRTAIATSLMRAVHARTAPQPLLDDDWGDRLIPETVRMSFLQAALERMDAATRAHALASPELALAQGFRASAAYADVITRARYTEDALQAAVARGIHQYVVIGAGFDSFALRRPAYARALNVYEVDHPATQELKRQRLKASGVPESDTLHFIAADLAAEDLAAALARSRFQPAQPTFFSWLGVTVYLTRAANLAALRAIASCAPTGSELVFSYADEVVFDPAYAATESFSRLRSQVSSAGEAFLSGFDPDTLNELLHSVGLQLLEDLNGDEMVARYDPNGINGLLSDSVAHVAHARVI